AKNARNANAPSWVISLPNRAAPMIEIGRFSSTVEEPELALEPDDESPLTVGFPWLTTVSAKSDRPDGEKNAPKNPNVAFVSVPVSVNVRPSAVHGATRSFGGAVGSTPRKP